MMLPEWAVEGTVTISPALVGRRRAPGELLEMRAPGVRGKATIIPVRTPLPPSSNVPRTETWRGLLLQRGAGVHFALVMRTEVTCALGALRSGAALAAGLAARVTAGGPPAPGGAPPGVAPAAGAPGPARGDRRGA